jgi:hypothetical protein
MPAALARSATSRPTIASPPRHWRRSSGPCAAGIKRGGRGERHRCLIVDHLRIDMAEVRWTDRRGRSDRGRRRRARTRYLRAVLGSILPCAGPTSSCLLCGRSSQSRTSRPCPYRAPADGRRGFRPRSGRSAACSAADRDRVGFSVFIVTPAGIGYLMSWV